MKKVNKVVFALLPVLLMSSGCNANDSIEDNADKTLSVFQTSDAIQTDKTEVYQSTFASEVTEPIEITEKENEIMLGITLSGKIFEAQLFDSITKDDITGMLPLELSMTRYAGHEFYAELPDKPVMDSTTTSDILAGHIYYWDGWNAFVINYEDCNISPYKVVHIGEITDKSIIQLLRTCGDAIDIFVENKE